MIWKPTVNVQGIRGLARHASRPIHVLRPRWFPVASPAVTHGCSIMRLAYIAYKECETQQEVGMNSQKPGPHGPGLDQDPLPEVVSCAATDPSSSGADAAESHVESNRPKTTTQDHFGRPETVSDDQSSRVKDAGLNRTERIVNSTLAGDGRHSPPASHLPELARQQYLAVAMGANPKDLARQLTDDSEDEIRSTEWAEEHGFNMQITFRSSSITPTRASFFRKVLHRAVQAQIATDRAL